MPASDFQLHEFPSETHTTCFAHCNCLAYLLWSSLFYSTVATCTDQGVGGVIGKLVGEGGGGKN